MLFEELQSRTNHMATYTEFEIVNAAYMASLDTNQPMDHDAAAKMWNGLYGAEHRRRERERQALIREMVEGAEQDLHMSERSDQVRKAIFNAEDHLRQLGTQQFVREPYYTDEMGITWKATVWGTTPNGCYRIYDLHVLRTVRGQTISTRVNYRYY